MEYTIVQQGGAKQFETISGEFRLLAISKLNFWTNSIGDLILAIFTLNHALDLCVIVISATFMGGSVNFDRDVNVCVHN